MKNSNVIDKYSVYIYVTPDRMVYVGMTNDFKRRRCSTYATTSLQSYIDKWGWERIGSYVVGEFESREVALKVENLLILYFKGIGRCINRKRSGHVFLNNPKSYFKTWQETHREEWRQYLKARRERLKAEGRI